MSNPKPSAAKMPETPPETPRGETARPIPRATASPVEQLFAEIPRHGNGATVVWLLDPREQKLDRRIPGYDLRLKPGILYALPIRPDSPNGSPLAHMAGVRGTQIVDGSDRRREGSKGLGWRWLPDAEPLDDKNLKACSPMGDIGRGIAFKNLESELQRALIAKLGEGAYQTRWEIGARERDDKNRVRGTAGAIAAIRATLVGLGEVALVKRLDETQLRSDAPQACPRIPDYLELPVCAKCGEYMPTQGTRVKHDKVWHDSKVPPRLLRPGGQRIGDVPQGEIAHAFMYDHATKRAVTITDGEAG